MNKPLKHDSLEVIRRQHGQSMLLFITDKCPVGCQHCSVDSRPDSPTIKDFSLFTEIVDWMKLQSRLEVIGISGGEPFVEKKGLIYAVEEFHKANKSIVIFTSGVWAKSLQTPKWIVSLLKKCNTIYLSTDAFHQDNITDACFMDAIKTIVNAGCWLVIQILKQDEIKPSYYHVQELLAKALGDHYTRFSEINLIKPLTNGRGKDIFPSVKQYYGRDLSSCSLVRNPMIRYDGQVSACCNEDVIMGKGPKQLRRYITSAKQITSAINDFQANPLLKSIGGVGIGALTLHPQFSDFTKQRFANNCTLCWRMLNRQTPSQPADKLLNLISVMEVS
ncbi:hypothetical protein AB835_03505 [Candidatus Endobugula sertula]|uniref:Radical SAM core domain-containing protein n=1 Tax=Candidatus Endobugula sertula TaxID=62101 RepID=A0A1D2QSG3_9GAMM|nr:hypothetical protein AB835_03505 [Candidatus Endobugula sertula]